MDNIYETLLVRAKSAGTDIEKICRKRGFVRRTITQWRFGVPKAIRMYLAILEDIEIAESKTAIEPHQKRSPE